MTPEQQIDLLLGIRNEIITIKGNIRDNYVSKDYLKSLNYINYNDLINIDKFALKEHKHNDYVTHEEFDKINLSNYVTHGENLSKLNINLDNISEIGKSKIKNIVSDDLIKLSSSIKSLSNSLSNYVTHEEFGKIIIDNKKLDEYVKKDDMISHDNYLLSIITNKLVNEYYNKFDVNDIIDTKINQFNKLYDDTYTKYDDFNKFRKHVKNTYLEKEDFISLYRKSYDVIKNSDFKNEKEFLDNFEKLNDGIYIVGTDVYIIKDKKNYPISSMNWLITNDY